MLRVARVTTVVSAALVAFAASCFSKPDDPRFQGDPDAGRDGMGMGTADSSVDAPPGTCTKQPFDEFHPGIPCAAWGTTYGSGTYVIQIATDELEVSPNGMGTVGCKTTTGYAIGVRGTSIQITQPANSNSYAGTYFRIHPAAMSTEFAGVRIMEMNASEMIVFECSGLAPVPIQYMPSIHKWFKIDVEPTFINQVIHLFYSADGNNWIDSNMSCSTWTSSASSLIVDMGVEGMGGGTAKFDHFNVKTCPP